MQDLLSQPADRVSAPIRIAKALKFRHGITRIMENGEHVIDIDGMLEGAEEAVTDECCIYRVPYDLRKLNEDAYTPKVVSIGPFHHNTLDRLLNMQKHKLRYCKAFLERTQITSDAWISYIESVEPQFRRCYSDTLHFTKEELVKIIFVDSGFILELFFRNYDRSWSSDVCLGTPWLYDSIREDLRLLENQLPFFVLDRLFNISVSNSNIPSDPSLIQLTFDYFGYYNSSKLSFGNTSIRHFTDLLRTFHLQHPFGRRPPRTSDLVAHLPSATELSEAGLRIKVNKDSKCLLDLAFSGGVLRIPQLQVHDGTEILFRNMIALEQCHYHGESYITDYVQIMDFLINTTRDVDILIQERVLLNWLGDTDSVANMFNGLFKNIVQSTVCSRYQLLYQDLNAFHRSRWNNLKSNLRNDYCKTPWRSAVSIGGIILIIFSFIQTVCSVMQRSHTNENFQKKAALENAEGMLGMAFHFPSITITMILSEVEKSIEAMLDRAEAPETDECCIYKVPYDIRKLYVDAYTPKVVSIGPFHHNTHPRLLNVERHQLFYCEAFLTRSEHP
ncbi:hypothetical protein Fmac_000755 [Flemingia macrophylla]|uniref:Uncharacterized protein n=1 Tax=Flemingia macrophylla TaxID=520843 RepID=A0ABD1NF65_9FABA